MESWCKGRNDSDAHDGDSNDSGHDDDDDGAGDAITMTVMIMPPASSTPMWWEVGHDRSMFSFLRWWDLHATQRELFPYRHLAQNEMGLLEVWPIRHSKKGILNGF